MRYRPEEAPESGFVTVPMTGPREVRARIEGLDPRTSYAYEITIDGEPHPRRQGRFATAPPEGAPARFRMAFTSCMHACRQPSQPSWYLLLAQAPDFQLLVGDNVYANTTDRDVLWRKHLEQRRVDEFALVIRSLPTYAVWDDHDYGPNNSDGTEPGKARSLRAFRELFANPSYGTDETPGVFYRFSWGDVDFFMLDGRYHRSPNRAPNDDEKRMLGDEQFRWLVDGLKRSQAPFKVLASGSTLEAKESDSWELYRFAKERLFRVLVKHRIEGVLYLSGDLHACRIDVHPPSETGGYPIYEVISSGIANSSERGFATIDFDTTLPDPTARVRILHGDGTVREERTIRRSELRPGGESPRTVNGRS